MELMSPLTNIHAIEVDGLEIIDNPVWCSCWEVLRRSTLHTGTHKEYRRLWRGRWGRLLLQVEVEGISTFYAVPKETP